MKLPKINRRALFLCLVLLASYAALWPRISAVVFPPRALFPDGEQIRALTIKNDYTVLNDDGGWHNPDGVKADPQKITEILGALTALKSSPLSKQQREELRQPLPIHGELTVTLPKREVTLVLGPPTTAGETRYAWLKEESKIFLVDSALLKRILKKNPVLVRPLLFDPAQVKQLVVERVASKQLPVTFKREGPRWFVEENGPSIVADNELVREYLQTLSELKAPPLFFPNASGGSVAKQPQVIPPTSLTIEVTRSSGQPLRAIISEVIRRNPEGVETPCLLLRLDGEQTLYEVEGALPPQIFQSAEQFRHRGLFAQLQPPPRREGTVSLCVFRGQRALFELTPQGKHWLITSGCGLPPQSGSEKQAMTSLVSNLLRLRAMSYLPLPSPVNKNALQVEPPLHFVLQQQRGERGKETTLQYTLTLTPLPSSADEDPPWEVTARIDKEIRALLSPEVGRTIMTEVRILESRVQP